MGLAKTTAASYARLVDGYRDAMARRGGDGTLAFNERDVRAFLVCGASPSSVHNAKCALEWVRIARGLPGFSPTLNMLKSLAQQCLARKTPAHLKPTIDVRKLLRYMQVDAPKPRTRGGTDYGFESVRNWCELLIAMYGFCRQSDVVSVDAGHVNVCDEFVAYRTRGTKELKLRRKPAGLSCQLLMGRVERESAGDPVLWFRRYIELRNDCAARSCQEFFCQQDGSPIVPNTVGSTLSKFLRAAGCDGSGHCFRSTFASAACDLGFDRSLVLSQGRWQEAATFEWHYNRRGVIDFVPDGPWDVSAIRLFPVRLWDWFAKQVQGSG